MVHDLEKKGPLGYHSIHSIRSTAAMIKREGEKKSPSDRPWIVKSLGPAGMAGRAPTPKVELSGNPFKTEASARTVCILQIIHETWHPRFRYVIISNAKKGLFLSNSFIRGEKEPLSSIVRARTNRVSWQHCSDIGFSFCPSERSPSPSADLGRPKY